MVAKIKDSTAFYKQIWILKLNHILWKCEILDDSHHNYLPTVYECQFQFQSALLRRLHCGRSFCNPRVLFPLMAKERDPEREKWSEGGDWMRFRGPSINDVTH